MRKELPHKKTRVCPHRGYRSRACAGEVQVATATRGKPTAWAPHRLSGWRLDDRISRPCRLFSHFLLFTLQLMLRLMHHDRDFILARLHGNLPAVFQHLPWRLRQTILPMLPLCNIRIWLRLCDRLWLAAPKVRLSEKAPMQRREREVQRD